MGRTPDYEKILISTSKEIMAVKDRVRHLIKDAHWGEDGRYKEAILIEFLRKSLPEYGIGTGFVVCERDITSQIDIIIYDRHKRSDAEILRQGDFVIVESKSVEAIIEVKSTFDSQIFQNDKSGKNAITKLLANKQIIERDKGSVFAGLFAFELGFKKIWENKNLQKYLASENFINCISFDEKHFMRFWNDSDSGIGADNYALYKFEEDFSFGYFISNLREHLKSECTGEGFDASKIKRFYAIKGNGKEGYKIASFGKEQIRGGVR